MLGKYKLGLRFKVAFVLNMLVLLSLFISNYTSYQQSKKIVENQTIELQQSQLKLLKHEIQSDLEEHQNILMSLVDTPPIQAIIRAIKNNNIDPTSNESLPVWQARLNRIFLAFLKNHSQYMQIRYIKSNGQELVRVERNANNQIIIANNSELQNKSTAEYVTETVKLPSGQVYFSDVSLNKEYGKIQQPHVPVLRIATPIYNNEGTVETLVVINLSTNKLFNKVTSTDQEISRYIVDQAGNYIKHQDVNMAFAQELGFEYNFFNIEKKWENEAKKTESLMRLDNSKNEIFGFQKIFFIPYDKSRYWLLTAHIPEEMVFMEIRKSLNNIILMDLFIGLMSLLIIIWFVSRKILYPILTLAKSAERLRFGDLSVRLDVYSVKDELRTLYYLINNFAETQQNNTLDLEQKIAAQTKRLSSIIDNVVDGIITIDAHGKIGSFNRASSTIFGYSEKEILGQNIQVLMPASYEREHDSYLAHHNKNGEKKNIGIEREVIGKRKDDTTFPMELALSEIEIDNNKHFVGIVRDITERKRVEQMQKEFISTVSHELRTPLTSISGSLGLVLGGVTGELPEKATKLLNIANTNSERLIHLINDILDVEKMSAGKMQFNFTVVDLIPLIDKSIDTNRGYGEKLNVPFIFNSTCTQPIMARIDEKRIEQVMSNLLSNAAKYSPTGEPVTISVEVVGHHINISVHDLGKGIPLEFRDKVFDRFAQADSSDTRQKGGTGLGLNITKAIIEEHKGQVNFSCEKGQGTTFNVMIPLWRDQKTLSHLVETPKHQPLVLIIEDDKDISRLLAMMIKKAGYRYHQAFNYKQAKELMAKNKYDIATLDLIFPGGEGLSLLKELRSNPATSKLPVIVIASPNNNYKNIKENDALEIIDWIEKPIDPDLLFKSLSVSLSMSISKKSHILHIEDDPDISTIVSSLLSNDYNIEQASTLSEAKELLKRYNFDLVLLDVVLPDGSGLDLLTQLQNNENPTPVVIFSAQDIPENISRQVLATLTKSKTDNEKLIQKIHAVINQKTTSSQKD